jgi:hypothetical protein
MLEMVSEDSLVAQSFQTGFLWKQLDLLQGAFEPRGFDATLAMTIVLAAAAGFALWSLSNGSLLASAWATTIPDSKRSTSFDPLLVLELWEQEFKGSRQPGADEETLQSLVTTSCANQDVLPLSPMRRRGKSAASPARRAQEGVPQQGPVAPATPHAGT